MVPDAGRRRSPALQRPRRLYGGGFSRVSGLPRRHADSAERSAVGESAARDRDGCEILSDRCAVDSRRRGGRVAAEQKRKAQWSEDRWAFLLRLPLSYGQLVAVTVMSLAIASL